MSSTDFGVLDFFLDKDYIPKGFSLGNEGFKNTIFSSSDKFSLDTPDFKEDIKEEELDWKMSSEWDADELLRSVLDSGSSDVVVPSSMMQGPTLASSPSPMGTAPMSVPTLGSSSLNTPTLQVPDDMDDLKGMVGLPFEVVLDSGASDSGMSSDSSLDQQMSPLSGCSVASPDSFMDMGIGGSGGFCSPDSGADTISEVSSVSDLGYTSPHNTSSAIFSTGPASPEPILGVDDFITNLKTESGTVSSSPMPQIVPELFTVYANCTSSSTTTVPTASPIVTHTPSVAPTIITRPSAANTKVTSVSSIGVTPAVLKTMTVSSSPSNGNSISSSTSTVGGPTIVVTQASKGAPTAQLVRGGTLLKSNQASRSILFPVTVKDINQLPNQVRTIKIISAGSTNGLSVNGRGVRTVVSTVRAPNTVTTTTTNSLNTQAAIRTALLTTVRSQESKSLLKGGCATTVVTSTRPSGIRGSPTPSSTHTSPTRIKSEYEDDDDDDDDDDEEARTSFQQLTLNDEEKRLLKKEGITLPSHYPLTKHEERELKRIRRKIRNKRSAQDSRKRKKEYIDGLEDRVKACTDENQQLQKRICSLEAQNESLMVQMRKFQSTVIGGSNNNGRSQAHASTALMMLILSAALFIVPSLRQDGTVSDNELSLPTAKMPSAGHSRSLLEAGNGAIPNHLEVLETVEDEMASDLDSPLVQALTDHDYTPAPKRQRTHNKYNDYYVPPLDDYAPQLGKTDSGGGFPPDDGSGTKIVARIMDAVAEHAANNFSDPGGKHSNSQSVVVNLGKGQKRLRDDLELE